MAKGFGFPLLLIFVGALLLLSNSGFLSPGFWVSLGKLWPVLLIIWGLDLLTAGSDSWLVRAGGIATIIAVIAAAFLFAWSGDSAVALYRPVDVRILVAKNLAGSNLAGADLSGLNLSGADLRGAILVGANLAGSDLSGSDMRGALLIGANFKNADLRGADMAGALSIGADFTGAKMS